MKKIVAIILFSISLLSSTFLYAANYGVGISAKDDDRYIYLPVSIHRAYRIEPFISYGDSEGEDKEERYGNSTESTYRAIDFGTGLFKVYEPKESIGIYYGARFSYRKTKSRRKSDGSYGKSYSNKKMSGYTFSPTLGIEYSLHKDFAIALESEWNYYDLDGKEERYDERPENITRLRKSKDKGNGTRTKLIIRYFFNA